jgi:hypothetical protein
MRQATTGVELIAAERQRQIDEEDWSASHDDSHVDGELALAAACYAIPPRKRKSTVFEFALWEWLWPWTADWWKPGRKTAKGRIRELAKAGALIAAELDRLQRKGA